MTVAELKATRFSTWRKEIGAATSPIGVEKGTSRKTKGKRFPRSQLRPVSPAAFTYAAPQDSALVVIELS